MFPFVPLVPLQSLWQDAMDAAKAGVQGGVCVDGAVFPVSDDARAGVGRAVRRRMESALAAQVAPYEALAAKHEAMLAHVAAALETTYRCVACVREWGCLWLSIVVCCHSPPPCACERVQVTVSGIACALCGARP